MNTTPRRTPLEPAQVDVLAVLDLARVCVAAYPAHDPMVHDGPNWDRAAALARHDGARAAVNGLIGAAESAIEAINDGDAQSAIRELRAALAAFGAKP